MTTNLEQIAKQVNLLNRLIELLRMQEEPETIKGVDLEKWSLGAGISMNYTVDGSFIFDIHFLNNPTSEITIEEAFNHPLTQKAWSNELVKVARELNTLSLLPFVFQGLMAITGKVWTQDVLLGDILSRYGRSLTE